ncbi:MAG: acetyl-CoA hydrolase/transferase family protein [Bacteroidetes bacterium]|nr:acetyl-CoA hydrolase/transferase family protein [Bacteroidota bacterium]
MKYTSAEGAMATVKSGQRVFIQSAAAAPQLLVEALTARHPELRGVEVTHMHTEGAAPYARPELAEAFHVNAFFVAGNIRPYIEHTNVQYIPMFLSEIPLYFRSGRFPLDVALIQVSPPDAHGFCSLGISVDITRAACDVARTIIAQVNPNMPRTLGDGLIHESRISAAVWTEQPIIRVDEAPLSERELAIGRYVSELVQDGATLQMGIGGIPNAALKFLDGHKDLGIHTEMFSDGVLPLIEKGVINGRLKRHNNGKIVSSFAMGSKKLYDFINDNPMVAMMDVAYVNDTTVIRGHDKMTAINTAVEVDITGQVCADSIGPRIYSGVGGQMDFMRGAALSLGGRPIIAMPATTGSGISKIVPTLKPGAGVVTTRAHIHYVVTEYGVADLYGRNIAQRAKALIDISHPDHRAELERASYELYGKCW